jgi:tRNA threonylcarbamoyladenosine biosynthesis protein TsaB
MLILAFDTTGERGGAGIFRDAECVASVPIEGPARYSVTLFQSVERLLAEAHLDFSEIGLFAVANGPGSFTGIRVGVAAAQGWATAFGRPVVGISVLAAMTELGRPETEWAAPIVDARRGELYLGLFRRTGELRAANSASFTARGDGCVLKPSQLVAIVREQLPAGAAITFLGREHDRLAESLKESLPDLFRWQTVRGSLLPALARIALEAHAQGKVQSPAELDACYIRRTDAELKWRE